SLVTLALTFALLHGAGTAAEGSQTLTRLLHGEQAAATIRVYRVEGLPNARIIISEGGVVVVEGEQMLFLNFGSRARAEEFLARRLAQAMPGATVRSFEVPRSFLNDL